MSVDIKNIRKHWQFYLMVLLPLTFIVVFAYLPMGGLVLAFKSFQIRKGIWGSPWAGMRYFEQFFGSPKFWLLLKNTLTLSIYNLIAGFPLPIILALMLNEIKSVPFKKTVQMVTYAPYFISTVVMVAMIQIFMDPRIGFLYKILDSFRSESIHFLSVPKLFKHIYVLSGIWQYTGYGAIIYIAALSGIDPTLYEAAKVDGASRFQRMVHIDIPGIAPTIIIMLILNAGRIMSVGFEKVYLLQNDLVLSSSEIIATYVYKIGLLGAQFSFSTAVGMFNSVVNLILIVSVNQIAKKVGETSLW